MSLAYKLPDGNVAIAFSGGRTSAYMLHQILEANGDLPERCIVSFQNTGREMPQTLDFVQECGERWGVQIVWLEYRPENPRFEVVSHNSASRNGEPFEALIRKRKFLPNRVARFCTAEMKVHCNSRYLKSIGWKKWTQAVGIRADEPNRLKGAPPRERYTLWHPLAEANVSRHDVSAFWARQPLICGCQMLMVAPSLATAMVAFLSPKRPAQPWRVITLTGRNGGQTWRHWHNQSAAAQKPRASAKMELGNNT